mmetsp:Transcript_77699/g.214747  ORF Transcript_77699/g.214747 Transcript_77699/m.214747 type:complete len:81 (-) Transcript_77699:19-261(-)
MTMPLWLDVLSLAVAPSAHGGAGLQARHTQFVTSEAAAPRITYPVIRCGIDLEFEPIYAKGGQDDAADDACPMHMSVNLR